MVYFRTYRSQTIAELDSPRLRETLYSVLGSQHIPQAFLFTGPKGLGKTSTARIIAKVLNCEHPEQKTESGKLKVGVEDRELKVEGKKINLQSSNIKDQPSIVHDLSSIEPCGHCSQCISITNGSNIDVLEIDGASNRGIDEIRDLREKVKLAPAYAKKKVYIIDEVHMLTTEAFNALLKTIEEPPAHVVFIFCTTEPQKVPATIISRCFHISLNRATEEELIHSLKRIIVKEKIEIEDDALALIAQMGDGGFRDTQKLFEEVVLLANGAKITKELVEEKVNVSGISYFVSRMLEELSKKEMKQCFGVVSELVEKGLDTKYFIAELLSALHQMLLAQVGVSILDTKYQIQNTSFSMEEITELVKLLETAYLATKNAVLPQLPLELAIVKWCTSRHSELVSESFPHVVPAKAGTQEKVDPGSESGMTNTASNMDTLLKKERNLKVQAVLKGTKETKETKETKVDSPHSQTDLPHNIADTAQFMENVIYKVKPFNHSVAGVLRGCLIRKIDGDGVVFETAYKFHKERLDEAKVKDILEQVVREITGKQLKIMVELKK